MNQITKLSIIVLTIVCQCSFAGSGRLYSVSTAGETLTIVPAVQKHLYPKASLTVTSPYTIASGCTRTSSNTCSFSMSSSAPATITLTGSTGTVEGTVCLNGNLSCQTFKTYVISQVAYVLNSGNNTISICPVDQGTLKSCSESDASGTLNLPTAIALNTSQTIAYIANFNGNNVSICSLTTNGISTCTTVTGNDGSGTPTFINPDGVAINSSGNYLYVSNGNGGTGYVSICPINGNGTLSACTVSYGNDISGNPTFNGAQSITLNTIDGVTYAYVTLLSDYVSVCPVIDDGATIGTCVEYTDSSFHTTQGAGFNAAGTVAYIGNEANSTISICPLNNNGSFATCSISTGNLTFDFSLNISIDMDMTSSSNYGYVPNDGTNTVSVCPIAVSNGALGTCNAVTDSTFNVPSGVIIKG